MPSEGLDVAVALLVYNRPELTQRAFDAIAAARPQRLYIVADGPRDAADAARCAEVRAIVRDVQWPCVVTEIFADANMGLRDRPATGITRVFESEHEAIILEDDCVPHPSFFGYCAELLERYRHDERVMHIGGSNHLLGRRTFTSSYFFSKHTPVWGWATWKRAWKHYDVAMTAWPAMREAGALAHLLDSPEERRFWYRAFDLVHSGRVVTWDIQWTFAVWKHAALGVIPAVNLVSNIGFGEEATNTRERSPLAAMPTSPIGVLSHPDLVERDTAADQIIWETTFQRSWLQRARAFMGRRMRGG